MSVRLSCLLIAASAAPALAQTLPAQAQTPPAINYGTDPARPTKSAALSYERLDLPGGGATQSLFADFNLPVDDGTTAIGVRAPLVAPDGGGGFGIGDIALQVTKVLPTGDDTAVVLAGGLEFDTATGPDRGTGKTVFTGTLIFEKTLPGGTIIAPTVAHSTSLWGRGDTGVSFTRLNLYFVPYLGNPKLYATVDPALTLDWVEDSQYADIAVTLGYKFGRLAGGDTQMFIRPSAGIGARRSFNWGVEFGLQLLNF